MVRFLLFLTVIALISGVSFAREEDGRLESTYSPPGNWDLTYDEILQRIDFLKTLPVCTDLEITPKVWSKSEEEANPQCLVSNEMLEQATRKHAALLDKENKTISSLLKESSSPTQDIRIHLKKQDGYFEVRPKKLADRSYVKIYSEGEIYALIKHLKNKDAVSYKLPRNKYFQPFSSNIKFSFLDGLEFHLLRNVDLSYTTIVDSDFKGSGINNYTRADLNRVSLKKTNNDRAIVLNAEIMNSEAQESSFYDAIIDSSTFYDTKFNKSDFSRATIKDSSFRTSDFRNSYFQFTTFDNVDLSFADISGAYFDGASINNLIFSYMPSGEGLPEDYDYAQDCRKLPAMPRGYFEVMKDHKERGIKHVYVALKAERQRNIHHCLLQNSPGLFDRAEALLNIVLFEYTTDWGKKPNKAVTLIFYLFITFGLFYWLLFLLSRRFNAIRRSFGKYRPSSEDEEVESVVGLTREDFIPDIHDYTVRNKFLAKHIFLALPLWCLACLGRAFQFSLITTFHYGFRNLNLGSCVTRLQFEHYIIKTHGFIRFLTGIQSLVSLYLVVIFFVTYFGDPFSW